VLRQLTEDKFIVKATNGPRYVVGCRRQLDKAKLKPGTRSFGVIVAFLRQSDKFIAVIAKELIFFAYQISIHFIGEKKSIFH
jgi:ATP-dependent 26S proteasome regulatory subunit